MDPFDKILKVIERHNRGSDTAIQTLTRLYRKNRNDDSLPALNKSNTRCWEEERSKPCFCGICKKVETERVAPNDSGHSIVVLVKDDEEDILDGHKRCRLWYKNRDQGKHTALFIESL